jgi:hypothetical protein
VSRRGDLAALLARIARRVAIERDEALRRQPGAVEVIVSTDGGRTFEPMVAVGGEEHS